MNGIYQHFRREDKDKIDMFNSKFQLAERNYYAVLLDFLDPQDKRIVDSLSGSYRELAVHYYGGGGNRERMRAIITPKLIPVETDDFEITVFEMKYPDKFVTLDHRNVLGAIMNVGVDRSKIGDVVIAESIQFALASPYKSLFIDELTRIKNAPVTLAEIPHAAFIEAKESGQLTTVVVSSKRLDTVVANVIKESRNKSAARIDKGLVKVNHAVNEDSSSPLFDGDVISIRHYGRIKLIESLGTTKKGKYTLKVETFSSK